MKNFYALGLKKFEKMNFKSSIILFTKSIKQNPHHIYSYLYRGLAYIEIEEFLKAIDDLTFVLDNNPDNDEAKSNLDLAKSKL